MKKISITIVLIISVLTHCNSESRSNYILLPSKISNMSKNGFYNLNRRWNTSSSLAPYVKNDVLYIQYKKGDGWPMLYTAPGEYKDDRKIPIDDNTSVIISFKNKIDRNIMFDVQIILHIKDNLEVVQRSYNCNGKNYIEVPIKKSESINNFNITLHGEEALVGIKEIYLK